MNERLKIQIDQAVQIVFLRGENDGPVAMSPPLLAALEEMLEQLDSSIQRLVITSEGSAFCNGADLFAVREMNEQQRLDFVQQGQRVFQRIAKLRIPTVAAINGNCLGGGLELAMVCGARVAVDKGSVNIGLPETKLGILPAWGGCTRLPKLIGLNKALPLILAGSTVPPRKAKRIGIIDEVAAEHALLAAATSIRIPVKRSLSVVDRVAGDIAPVRNFVLKKAEQQTQSKTYGNYPAPLRAIDVVRTGLMHGVQAGLEAERKAVAELANTDAAKNLTRLFFLQHAAKKADDEIAASARSIRRTAVVGGGTMGAGIIHALVGNRTPVRLIEIDHESVSRGLQNVHALLVDDVRRKRKSQLEADDAMRRITTTTNYDGLAGVDFVIEAAPEKLAIKQKIFALLDQATSPDAILATNTSSLRVSDIAVSVADASRIIGLHFFNPVNRMPLVEIVRTDASRDEAVATGFALAKAIGKTPIITGDGPGFVVNRVLIPYMAQAVVLVSEGVPIGQIDKTMRRFGMPMGPIELLDQVGLDVAVDILQSIGARLGDRVPAVPGFEQVIEKGWLGKKTNRGFYEYSTSRRVPNTELLSLLRGERAKQITDQDIMQRLVHPMLIEAKLLLEEGIVKDADTIDLATVFGTGFAPFRGGLMMYAETSKTS